MSIICLKLPLMSEQIEFLHAWQKNAHIWVACYEILPVVFALEIKRAHAIFFRIANHSIKKLHNVIHATRSCLAVFK